MYFKIKIIDYFASKPPFSRLMAVKMTVFMIDLINQSMSCDDSSKTTKNHIFSHHYTFLISRKIHHQLISNEQSNFNSSQINNPTSTQLKFMIPLQVISNEEFQLNSIKIILFIPGCFRGCWKIPHGDYQSPDSAWS